MVRSYSAMAISSRASATLRLPFLAPQPKMGRLIEGPTLQLSPSFPIKFPRSVEEQPILPVSEMDGKKAARVAQILARPARRVRTSVVEGNGVSVGVDRGGRCIITKKKK